MRTLEWESRLAEGESKSRERKLAAPIASVNEPPCQARSPAARSIRLRCVLVNLAKACCPGRRFVVVNRGLYLLHTGGRELNYRMTRKGREMFRRVPFRITRGRVRIPSAREVWSTELRRASGQPNPSEATLQASREVQSMSCKNCGRPLPEGSRFCNYCGSQAAGPAVGTLETSVDTVGASYPIAADERVISLSDNDDLR